MNNLSGAKIPNIYYMEEFNNIKLLNIAYLEVNHHKKQSLFSPFFSDILCFSPFVSPHRTVVKPGKKPSMKPIEGDRSLQEPFAR